MGTPFSYATGGYSKSGAWQHVPLLHCHSGLCCAAQRCTALHCTALLGSAALPALEARCQAAAPQTAADEAQAKPCLFRFHCFPALQTTASFMCVHAHPFFLSFFPCSADNSFLLFNYNSWGVAVM
jgi:hypothetical protein